MAIERVMIGPVGPGDVLVEIKAASLCHTDLEVIEGQLALKLPAVLGHEAAGMVAALGEGVTGLAVGDPVVLSWNPHCGHCFYCDAAQPILCEQYLANGPKAVHFDGRPRLACDDGGVLHQLIISVVSRNTAWCRRNRRCGCPPPCRSTAPACSAAR